MAWRKSLQAAIRDLKREQTLLLRDLDAVRARIEELEALTSAPEPRKRTARKKVTRGKPRLSADGRDAISKAAKKRWARYRAEKRKGTR